MLNPVPPPLKWAFGKRRRRWRGRIATVWFDSQCVVWAGHERRFNHLDMTQHLRHIDTPSKMKWLLTWWLWISRVNRLTKTTCPPLCISIYLSTPCLLFSLLSIYWSIERCVCVSVAINLLGNIDIKFSADTYRSRMTIAVSLANNRQKHESARAIDGWVGGWNIK